MAASRRPSPAAWGYDLVGYLPAPIRTPLILLTALGVGLILSTLMRSERAASSTGTGPRGQPIVLPLRWLPWLLLIPYAWLLWSLRTRNYLLGDQLVWITCFREHQHHLYSEPLAATGWYLFVAALQAFRLPISEPILAVLPVLCGVAFAIIAWKIAGLLVPAGRLRPFPFFLLLTLGTVELYCGYIESYPLASIPIFAFLWLSMRNFRAGGSGIPVAISFALAIASHIVAIYLAPAYLYWLIRRKIPAVQRILLAAVPVAIVALLFYVLNYPIEDLINPFRVLRVAVESSRTGMPYIGPGNVVLLQRGLDLLNLFLLIMPVPLSILLCRCVAWKPEPPGEERAQTFLIIAAIAGILAAATLVVPGSPAQDWDLMSLTIIPLAVLAISMLGVRDPLFELDRVRWGLTAIALASAAAFVLVNADREAGTQRFKTLVGPAARLSAHERAYGSEKLMDFYRSQGERDSTLVYARRALAVDPASPRYLTNVGFSLYELGRDDEAIPYLEESIRRDPTRWAAHYNLGLCLVRKERYAEAADALGDAVQNGGSRPDVLHALGIALFRSGKADSAVATWRQVLARWPGYASQLRRRQGGVDVAPPGVPATR